MSEFKQDLTELITWQSSARFEGIERLYCAD